MIVLRWRGKKQRTDRGSPPVVRSCSICLSPPLSSLTLPVMKQILRLRVQVLAALLQPPQKPPGCFSRLSSASQPLCQTSDVNISTSFSISPPHSFCTPPQRALLNLSSLTPALHTFLPAGRATSFRELHTSGCPPAGPPFTCSAGPSSQHEQCCTFVSSSRLR